MDNIKELRSLFNLTVAENAPHFIIYTTAATSRLIYVCDFIFTQCLNVKCRITSDLAFFQNADAHKINYGEEPVSSCFNIHPAGILQERSLPAEPASIKEKNTIYFYPYTGLQKFELGYDLFSAVFYFISRAEEWAEYTPDAHGRFEAQQSILFRHKSLLKPVVDIWITGFRHALLQFFPGLILPGRQFKVVSTVDVDNLYAFRKKGALRTLGAIGTDLLKFRAGMLYDRLKVLAGIKKDPFDIYAEISEFCSVNNIPLFYFFLFNTGNQFDRTVSPQSGAFRPVFNTVRNKNAYLGLHPSYFSEEKPTLLKKELQMISQESGEEVVFSRQHYLKFNIRTTPGLLKRNGLCADFTMGFASQPGFRAGTTVPFYYYDFSNELPTALLFVPFCAMDGAFFIYKNITPDQAMQQLNELALEIKRAGGFFTTVFHERTFYNHLYKGFGTLYKKLHLRAKQLEES